MVTSSHRMRRSRDFRATARDGRRAGSGTLVVHQARDEHAGDAAPAPTLVGLVVARTVGGAVVRNRVRRRLRALLVRRLDDLGSGRRVVVRALPAAATAPSETLGRDLDAALRRTAQSGPGGAGPGGARR